MAQSRGAARESHHTAGLAFTGSFQVLLGLVAGMSLQESQGTPQSHWVPRGSLQQMRGRQERAAHPASRKGTLWNGGKRPLKAREKAPAWVDVWGAWRGGWICRQRGLGGPGTTGSQGGA